MRKGRGMDEKRIARALAETLRWACRPCGRLAAVRRTGLPVRGSAGFVVTDMLGARYRVTVEPI
jgi:hypothetical protein